MSPEWKKKWMRVSKLVHEMQESRSVSTRMDSNIGHSGSLNWGRPKQNESMDVPPGYGYDTCHLIASVTDKPVTR